MSPRGGRGESRSLNIVAVRVAGQRSSEDDETLAGVRSCSVTTRRREVDAIGPGSGKEKSKVRTTTVNDAMQDRVLV
jgi:hypothetical protein